MKNILLSTLAAVILLFIPSVNFAQTDIAASFINSSTNIHIKRISIYPNPSSGNITLQFTSAVVDNYVLNIIDITGKLIFRDKIAAAEGINIYKIDLSNAVKGIYLLTVENANMIEQERFIIQQPGN